MRSWVRVLWMVVGGFIGAYAGYWIGYLLGWSSDAEWPFRVGGGTGAILLWRGEALGALSPTLP